MIQVSNLTVTFGDRDLFKDISITINPKDRIGLVGKNGVGKSTLLKIVAGQQKPTSGQIVVSDNETIGYLPQEIKSSSTLSIYDEAMKAFDEVLSIENEIEELNQQLAERTDYESDEYMDMINRLTECHDRVHHLGAGKMESEVFKVLLGLGFAEKDLQRPMSEFSGGWQMRVELAKLLLAQPSLLLLDEPTNHLDIESILWLEDLFKNYNGAIMMVSHDRAFLDNITNRTVEIVFGKIYDYKANYSKYLVLREERLEQQRNAYKNQQQFIAQQERFIERFKAKATKASQAQSAQKRLDKVERIEFDEIDTSSIQFRFPQAPRSGDVVVRTEKLGKAYGNKQVLKNLTFDITRGERIALVGKNGMGKSTLVKVITGETDHTGILKVGHLVQLGYYAQIQEKTLDDKLTVFQTIDNEATGDWRSVSKIRGLLGAFLFGENDIDKKVKVLSGGEKSRLALARLLLNPVNLLILDEPTNHLDIAAKEMLKEALKQYDGTLILVSHDRDFLEGLTNRTFEFTENGVKEHYGSITEFLETHMVDTFRDFEASGPKQKESKKDNKNNNNDYQQKKEKEKQLRKLKKDVEQAEKQISKLEGKLAGLVQQLQDPEFFKDEERSKAAMIEHDQLKKDLDNAMASWEKHSELLEQEQAD